MLLLGQSAEAAQYCNPTTHVCSNGMVIESAPGAAISATSPLPITSSAPLAISTSTPLPISASMPIPVSASSPLPASLVDSGGRPVIAAGFVPALASSASSAPEANHVFANAAATLASVSVTNLGTGAAYLMLFDAASVPADGAVSPKLCQPVTAAPGSWSRSYGTSPAAFAVGIVAALSSTGCTTLSSSGESGFFSAQVTTGAGVATVSSTTAETGHVIKAAAGTLLDFQVANLGAAGYLVALDAAAVPASGASLAPKFCQPVYAAPAGLAGSYGVSPAVFATGVVLAVSTSCTTLTTTGLSAFFGARVQ